MTTEDKLKLFAKLFVSRKDVFGKQFVSKKTGEIGYAPLCHNAWKARCPKRKSATYPCPFCRAKAFDRYDNDAIKKHIQGKINISLFACYFDGTTKLATIEVEAKDACPFTETLKDNNLPIVIEKRQEKYRFWFFFLDKIPIDVARKFVMTLITEADLGLDNYSNIYPVQDNIPKGTFGCGLPLPFNYKDMENGFGYFVDESLARYENQWEFLKSVTRISGGTIFKIVSEYSIGPLRQNPDDTTFTEENFDKDKFLFKSNLKIEKSNMLKIAKKDIGNLNYIKRMCSFRNLDFHNTDKAEQAVYDKPFIISCYDEDGDYIYLPRGVEEDLKQIMNNKMQIVDKQELGEKIACKFVGKLRDRQEKARKALLAHDNGILHATTAFGKTVVAGSLIASRGVNALALVHRASLQKQWIERLQEFLDFDFEIGTIGGGKYEPKGNIDIALMQSLISKGEIKEELLQGYGMVIIDECHHASASTFLKIVKSIKAKYLYGLTATPRRKDVNQGLIYLTCGGIRYRADSKGENRNFKHIVIAKHTDFCKPDDRFALDWNYSQMLADMIKDEKRNGLILADVKRSIYDGRTPIVITERIEHAEKLYKEISKWNCNSFLLLGGQSKSISEETLDKINNVPENEPLVLIATGKYIGEGFDLPRLDTLFLTMPISWEGTVKQYIGRLHRNYIGKNDVIVYDYVDSNVPVLIASHKKRLDTYKDAGYEIERSLSEKF